MIIFLDTATPTCYLTVLDGSKTTEYQWLAERQLAQGLLQFIVTSLDKHNTTIAQLTGMVVMKGPGSFTGLRIGCTVVNTIAQFEAVPLVGVSGDDWQTRGQQLLAAGYNHQLVVPDYGRPARVTKPRK